ncbi:TonB-dependent hemoglobin/transferrin/lactoferrin family receptor [Propylenella binzhouense]|uniref:TonB-dependent hemoglobin/transferrin/lactoferrin family receptor n=1 Tax=Propylenella binzhouense TaxID=2555902 RepID=UPI0031B5FF43
MDGVLLDAITIVASKTEERWIDTLASVSVVDAEDLERLQPTNAADIFFGMPGVTATQDANPTSMNINIRGLQDSGRVAVVVDGARRNFQINGHQNAAPIWIDPDLLDEVSVVRGPVSNIYGSGAIGGVVSFETKTASDFLRAGETAAASVKTRYETNGEGFTTTATAAARITDAFDAIGSFTYRDRGDYSDGDGDTVLGTGFEVVSGMAKATIRPAEFHEITLGWIGDAETWSDSLGEVDTDVAQNTLTAKYTYSDPGNDWVDLTASVYRNQTELTQKRLVDEEYFTGYDPSFGFPIFVTLPAGSRRNYDIATTGFDVYNTSRLQTGALRHTVTYGGDYFVDEVDTADSGGLDDVFNPSGDREAYGAFVQDRIEFSNWLEIVGAVRYDGYSLDGDGEGSSGDRFSPRLTLGVSPFEETGLRGLQVYGTYAEGYRAPTLNETLITGLHPVIYVPFTFLTNPGLKPETARTFEVGVNVKRDGIFTAEDGFRAKAAWFHNRVSDYIGMVGVSAAENAACPPYPNDPIPGISDCYQYQNIDEAEIEGFEAEAVYDMGWMFTGVRGSIIRGDNADTDEPLSTIPADQVTGMLGFRFLERRLTVGGELQFVAKQDRVPSDVPETDGYSLVNLFASYQPNENFRLDFRIDNLFDEAYANNLSPVLGTQLEEGFNATIAATIRFGG